MTTPQSKIRDFCQLAAASPVGGSDSPPDCHSLPPTALRLPLTRGAFWVRRRKGERYMKATGIVRRVDE